MAVLGTSCVLCALPLEHDHYVPSREPSLLKIYRGSNPAPEREFEPGEPFVRFGPEHAWLRVARGLRQFGDGPEIVCGTVEDGFLTDAATGYVSSVSDEEHLAVHDACWRLLGEPRSVQGAVKAWGTHPYALAQCYQEQLFDFQSLIADAKAWMLHDPEGSGPDADRSRARILHLLGVARATQAPPQPRGVAVTVRDMLRRDRPWRGLTLRDGDRERRFVVRYRDAPPDLDRQEYPSLIWLMKEYDGDAAGMPTPETLALFEDFEVALKAEVERGEGAVVMMTSLGEAKGQYVVYAKDEAATMERIRALPACDRPRAAMSDNERDPQWRVFFEQIAPRRRYGA